jgi:hypothetical protein
MHSSLHFTAKEFWLKILNINFSQHLDRIPYPSMILVAGKYSPEAGLFCFSLADLIGDLATKVHGYLTQIPFSWAGGVAQVLQLLPSK